VNAVLRFKEISREKRGEGRKKEGKKGHSAAVPPGYRSSNPPDRSIEGQEEGRRRRYEKKKRRWDVWCVRATQNTGGVRVFYNVQKRGGSRKKSGGAPKRRKKRESSSSY